MASGPLNLHNPEFELVDPTPDIHSLFVQYNEMFFEGALGAVTVEWSKRMTSCAGLCYYQGRAGGCRIKLSEPLLQYRPRKDLINTLIHEMIHAYLFIKNGLSRLDRDGHGPDFQGIMNTINKVAGTSITVYHSFHDEVDHFRTHWWQCNGPCRNRRPFFGLVKRAMNRAPGPNDTWYADHKATCNGTFIKIKEPEKPQKKKVEETNKKQKLLAENAKGTKSITNWMTKKTGNSSAGKINKTPITSTSNPTSAQAATNVIRTFPPPTSTVTRPTTGLGGRPTSTSTVTRPTTGLGRPPTSTVARPTTGLGGRPTSTSTVTRPTTGLGRPPTSTVARPTTELGRPTTSTVTRPTTGLGRPPTSTVARPTTGLGRPPTSTVTNPTTGLGGNRSQGGGGGVRTLGSGGTGSRVLTLPPPQRHPTSPTDSNNSTSITSNAGITSFNFNPGNVQSNKAPSDPRFPGSGFRLGGK